MIQKDKKQQSKNIKILLLGTSMWILVASLLVSFLSLADMVFRRCWGVRKIYHFEADAIDTHRRLSVARTQGSPPSYLFQHGRGIQNNR